jgi:hypothetical protein
MLPIDFYVDMSTNPANQLGYPRVVLAEDSVVARGCSNFSHPITDWSFSLVRKPDSTGVATAPEALEGAAGVGWGYRRTVNV